MRDQSVYQYTELVARGTATPGGGHVAGVTAAMGCALLSMVVALSLGREKYRGIEAALRTHEQTLNRLRTAFLDLADADMMAFDALMSARKLSREPGPRGAGAREAYQEAIIEACRVPMECIDTSGQAMEIGQWLIVHANQHACADAFAGMQSMVTAIRISCLNVRANAGSLTDVAVAKRWMVDAERAADAAESLASAAFATLIR